MGFMLWSNDYAFGLPAVDAQHRWLFTAINALHRELGAPQPQRGNIGQILEGLVDYTMNHFVAEEEMFERYGYPQAVAHKAEHDRFTAQALELLTRFEAGEGIPGDTMDFLKNWLAGHILKMDRDYVPFLKSATAH